MAHFKSNLLVFSLVATAFISSCSNDEEKSNKSITNQSTNIQKKAIIVPNKLTDKQNYDQMSKPLDQASWVERGRFKKEFAADCVARELNSADKSKLDRDYIEKTCACIADEMDEGLTDQEADEYLRDDNHNRSLQIRFDAAAYHCMQK